MIGNLHHEYILRTDRLRRLRERYRCGELTEPVFRAMLRHEGYDRTAQDAEVGSTFRHIGQVANGIVERIKP